VGTVVGEGTVVAAFIAATVVVALAGRVVAAMRAKVVTVDRAGALVAGSAAFFVRVAVVVSLDSLEPPHAESARPTATRATVAARVFVTRSD
jgi:hypothetical protein